MCPVWKHPQICLQILRSGPQMYKFQKIFYSFSRSVDLKTALLMFMWSNGIYSTTLDFTICDRVIHKYKDFTWGVFSIIFNCRYGRLYATVTLSAINSAAQLLYITLKEAAPCVVFTNQSNSLLISNSYMQLKKQINERIDSLLPPSLYKYQH